MANQETLVEESKSDVRNIVPGVPGDSRIRTSRGLDDGTMGTLWSSMD
jgi:hypothetical protein